MKELIRVRKQALDVSIAFTLELNNIVSIVSGSVRGR